MTLWMPRLQSGHSAIATHHTQTAFWKTPWHIVGYMWSRPTLQHGAMLCFYAVLVVNRAKVPDLTLLSQKASIVISEAQHLHIYQVTKQ